MSESPQAVKSFPRSCGRGSCTADGVVIITLSSSRGRVTRIDSPRPFSKRPAAAWNPASDLRWRSPPRFVKGRRVISERWGDLSRNFRRALPWPSKATFDQALIAAPGLASGASTLEGSAAVELPRFLDMSADASSRNSLNLINRSPLRRCLGMEMLMAATPRPE